jgi:hypothetical protein
LYNFTTLEEAEVIPGKHSDTRARCCRSNILLPFIRLVYRQLTAAVPFMINITHLRIKPLPSTNGHGRYITTTPEQVLVSVGEWPLHVNISVINL